MLFVVPSLCGISLVFLGTLVFRFLGVMSGLLYLLLLLGIITAGAFRTNFLTSFIWHQYYLFAGLVNMVKPMHLWESVDRTALH